MHVIQINLAGKETKYTAPDNWDSLTHKQLLQWCSILRMELSKKEAFTLAVYLFYKIPFGIFSQCTPAQDAQLRLTLNYLSQNTLTKNILGYVRVLFRKFHGPANRLSNITIAEYRRTELYYDLYLKTGQKNFLYLLAATLFRPAGGKSGNDRRCPITEKGVSRRAEFFKWALHPNALIAIKLFYEGCREYIFTSHPIIYKRDTATKSKNNHPIADLEDHILAFSGDKLGNFNETQETNLYVFLKHMTQRIEEYEKHKK